MEAASICCLDRRAAGFRDAAAALHLLSCFTLMLLLEPQPPLSRGSGFMPSEKGFWHYPGAAASAARLRQV